MSALFSDDFNRANTSVTTPNYGEYKTDQTGTFDGWSIVSNAIQSITIGTGSATIVTTTTAHAAIADVEVAIDQVGLQQSDGGPCARVIQPGTTSWAMYGIDAEANGTGNFIIYRFTWAAGWVVIASVAMPTKTAPGTIKLRVEGSGATVTLTGYYNGAMIIQTTDTAGNRVTGAAQAGVFSWTISTTNNSNAYDNLVVSDTIPISGGVQAPANMRRFPKALMRRTR